MKLPDPEQFNFKDCEIVGDKCWLITPTNMSVDWTDENARFRSCIVRQSDNFVVSQGFGKFTNFGERPDFQPWDKTWKVQARHKLDGSLLIVSRYKGEMVIRTRGTTDARNLPNGDEIEKVLFEKFPHVFESGWWTLFKDYTHPTTLLFEWTTPSNIIVLREHNEPTLTLVGAVDNKTCKYWSQDKLDDFGTLTLKVNRPEKYEYNSIEECILDVTAWKGKEGVVLYSPDGQTLKKIKADEYCELHKLATGITNIGHVLDVFMASPKFDNYEQFYKYVELTLDYEIAEKCKDYMENIVEAYRKFLKREKYIKHHIDSFVRSFESRRDQANEIFSNFGKCWGSSYGFLYLDHREVDQKLIRKAIECYLNKN